jgi:hypothetical protein
MFGSFAQTRSLAAVLGAVALTCATSMVSHAGPITVTCTNNASGTNWQINIDYDHGTVDSVPATISDAQIAWHTADGQHYRLDRKTGNLAVVLASSTGGSFIYHHCKLDR